PPLNSLILSQGSDNLDDVTRPRAPVKPVDVLRHDRPDPALLLQLRERAVPAVWLGLGERVEPERVELPDPRGIAPKRIDVRDLEGVVTRPDSLGREIGR